MKPAHANKIAWLGLRTVMTSAWLLTGAALMAAMSHQSAKDSITSEPFDSTPDGSAVERYTLRNRYGMEAKIATYCGILTSPTAPDRNGHYADVVLGYETPAGYLKCSPYFGALIGRYGNRIAHGKFTPDGIEYTLATNNGPNSLHGGNVGFDKAVWKVAKAKVTPQGPQLTLKYIRAVYTLTEDNALRLEYTATTDKDTVLNLTQQSYFNLRGLGDILGHLVQINADLFTTVDNTMIPTGELKSVEGTSLDFRNPTAIGMRIEDSDDQLRFGQGYDRIWVISNLTRALALQATVYEPQTGRVLEVLSTEPLLQFYSGNFLDGSITGKGDAVYKFRDGLTLEPQHFPDSPNHPNFPSTVLKPGDTFRNTIVHRFSAR
jgi:aldose 1-epimerase